MHKGIRNILSAFFWSIERVAVCIGSGFGVFVSSSAAESLPRTLDALLENHCLDCHDDVERKGGINAEYFREIFRFTQREQLVSASNAVIQARLHRKDQRYFLWIVNPTRQVQESSIKISDGLGGMKFNASHWSEYRPEVTENRFTTQVPARDVLILEFES